MAGLELLAALVVLVHSSCALFILLYQVGQMDLLRRLLRAPRVPGDGKPTEYPVLTLQLPIYNERTTVEGLLESVAALRYPRDCFEVQLLDDSTDETVALAARKVAELRRRGLDIHHLRRPDREGFKAGALAYGLTQARGELIAILDADFRPRPDYLERMVAVLERHPHWGLAQARWAHLNRETNLFTSALALHLDTHFSIEQEGRSQAPLFMGFNGTAGVWRRETIEAAGGWSADSLTEDLDLAFRAQLAGWKLGYVDDIEVPAELPEQVSMLRTQQHRWIKGGTQVCHKLLARLWRSPQPLVTKLQGTLHLASTHLFAVVLGMCVINPLVPIVLDEVPWASPWLAPSGPAFQFIIISVLTTYAVTCLKREAGPRRAARRFVSALPSLVSLSSGLSALGTKAVWEAWRGEVSPFVRTAKSGEGSERAYRTTKVGAIAYFEVFMALWLTAGLVFAVTRGHFGIALFLALQSVGFWVMTWSSELRLRLPRAPRLQTRTDP